MVTSLTGGDGYWLCSSRWGRRVGFVRPTGELGFNVTSHLANGWVIGYSTLGFVLPAGEVGSWLLLFEGDGYW